MVCFLPSLGGQADLWSDFPRDLWGLLPCAAPQNWGQSPSSAFPSQPRPAMLCTLPPQGHPESEEGREGGAEQP